MVRLAEWVGPHAPPSTAFCPSLWWLAEPGNRADFEIARRNFPDILVLPHIPWGCCHHWDLDPRSGFLATAVRCWFERVAPSVGGWVASTKAGKPYHLGHNGPLVYSWREPEFAPLYASYTIGLLGRFVEMKWIDGVVLDDVFWAPPRRLSPATESDPYNECWHPWLTDRRWRKIQVDALRRIADYFGHHFRMAVGGEHPRFRVPCTVGRYQKSRLGTVIVWNQEEDR